MELDELRAFLALAQHGTLSEAARQTGLPRNTMRRRVEALESRIGTPLLVRDGRRVGLTAVGRQLVGRGQPLVSEAEALITDLQSAVRIPEGRVRVLVPISNHPLTAMMVWRMVRTRHPGMQVELRFLEDPASGLESDGDFAMYWGHSLPEGLGFARRVGIVPLRLLASRVYVEMRGDPTTIEQLAEHDLLCFDCPDLTPGTLPLLAGGTIPVEPSLLTTNVQVAGETARHGGGIALAPNVRLPGDGWPEEDGVVVLGDVVGCDLPIWLLSRGALSDRPALKPMLEEISALMQTMGIGG